MSFALFRITPLRAAWLSVIFLTCLVAAKWTTTTGFTALLGFGSKWDGKRTVMLSDIPVAVKKGSGGYDAQFYAQFALDPTLRHPDFDNAERFVDWPSYRARRIGLPVVAHALGFGRPRAVLEVFALINPLCWALFAVSLWRWLKPSDGFGFAKWFFCCFSIGAIESVRLAQTDLPAMLLMLLPLLFPEKIAAWGRGAAFASAVFVKETALSGFVALPWRREFRASFWTAALAGSAFALWLFYVYKRLGVSAGDTSNFAAPFVGALDFLKMGFGVISRGFDDGRFWFGVPACLGLLAQGAWLVRRHDFKDPIWRFAAANAVLIPFISMAVWGGHWNAGRVLLPVTIGFNLLYDRRDRIGVGLLLLVNLPSCVHGIIRFL